MSKRAFLITGPQHTGNHLIRDVFTKCFDCEDLRSDIFLKKPTKDLVSFGWSTPCGGIEFWDMSSYINKLKKDGYKTTLIITSRDWYSSYNTYYKNSNKTKTPILSLEEVIYLQQTSLNHIFGQIIEHDLDYITISYESIIYDSKNYIINISKLLNLKYNNRLDFIYNGNTKYFNVTR